MGRAIAIATPFFFALIGLEYAWGRLRGRNTYRLNDAVNSLSLGVLSQLSNLFTQLLRVGLYAFVWAQLAIWKLPADAWWAWVTGIVVYDFCYYWHHRVGHESAVFWASHVVHHQSQEFNLSTALRQTSSGALLGWLFYLPMAVIGFPPQVFAVAALIDLLYQYWIHTEHVGRLGWLDRILATPSNHRVHHAINDRCVDRNYGGILIVWDRLFGSFAPEGERCVYGTRAPLDSWDPIWANVEIYVDLARKAWRTPRWRDKLKVWLKPPGWCPPDADPAIWAAARFDLDIVRRYDPPTDPAMRWFATIALALSIVATLPLLWFADRLPMRVVVAWALAVTSVLWLAGAVSGSPSGSALVAAARTGSRTAVAAAVTAIAEHRAARREQAALVGRRLPVAVWGPAFVFVVPRIAGLGIAVAALTLVRCESGVPRSRRRVAASLPWRRRRADGGELHDHGILQELRGKGADLVRHRRGEEQRLPLGRQCLDETADVALEADVGQAIRGIDREKLDAAEIDRALRDMIEQPSGGRDDDIDAVLEDLDLGRVVDAALDQHTAQLELLGVAAQSVFGARSELPGWHQEERAWRGPRVRDRVVAQALQHGQPVRERPPRAIPCERQEISPGQDGLNRLPL